MQAAVFVGSLDDGLKPIGLKMLHRRLKLRHHKTNMMKSGAAGLKMFGPEAAFAARLDQLQFSAMHIAQRGILIVARAGLLW